MRDSLNPKDCFICKRCSKMFSAQSADSSAFRRLEFPKGDLSTIKAKCHHCHIQSTYVQADILRHSDSRPEPVNEDMSKLINNLESKIDGLIAEVKDKDSVIREKDDRIKELSYSNTKLATAISKLTSKITGETENEEEEVPSLNKTIGDGVN